MPYDLFISHAWEDKKAIARPIALALGKKGLRVWYDELSLKPGDRLLESIDKGLRDSNYGVVILSPDFFRKNWPRNELDGLMSGEAEGQTRIIPVWHNVSKDEVYRYSPVLAGRVGIVASGGNTRYVVKRVVGAMSSPNRAFTKQVTALVERIQRGEQPFAGLVAEALGIARKAGCEPLASFCESELSGWSGPDPEAWNHRFSPYFVLPAPLQPDDPRWKDDARLALVYMSTRYASVRFDDTDSIAEIERRDVGPATSLAQRAVPIRRLRLIPSPSDENATVYLYSTHDANVRVVMQTRAELTKRLSDFLNVE